MRLFIALKPSEAMKKDLIHVMHDMKQLGTEGRYVPASNLQITLAFLGEVTDLDSVKEVMKSLPVEKSRLTFSEYGFSRDVFWIGIKGNQKIKKYVADLRLALKQKGLPVDMQKFEPHITLLRGQKGKRPQGLSIPSSDMTVSQISLFRSDVKDGKRVYKEIFTV